MPQESWKLDEEEAPPGAPSLCSNNCGFFGSSPTLNLCSACYRDLLLLKPQSPIPNPQSPSPSPSASSSSSIAGRLAHWKNAIFASPPNNTSNALAQPAPNRCSACRKRVGPSGFKCRCGAVFCAVHRYCDKHDCGFDYKAAGRAAISKANPVVKGEKLSRI